MHRYRLAILSIAIGAALALAGGVVVAASSDSDSAAADAEAAKQREALKAGQRQGLAQTAIEKARNDELAADVDPDKVVVAFTALRDGVVPEGYSDSEIEDLINEVGAELRAAGDLPSLDADLSGYEEIPIDGGGE